MTAHILWSCGMMVIFGARITFRMLLQSAAPHTMIELAKSGFGIAVVPSLSE